MSKDLSTLVLELGLTLALLAAAQSGLRGLRRDWATLKQQRPQASGAFAAPPRPVVDTLGGVAAANGRPVLLEIPEVSSGFVLFVLHAQSLQSDLALWMQVATLLRGKSGLELVGYCDGLACDQAVRDLSASEPFPIVGFAEYHTASVLARADRQNEALVLGARLTLVRTVSWTHGKDPHPIAAAIAGPF